MIINTKLRQQCLTLIKEFRLILCHEKKIIRSYNEIKKLYIILKE